MNSFRLCNNIKPVSFNLAPLKRVNLNGKIYKIFWTVHAKNRAENRGNSSVIILNTYLSNTLKAISKLKEFDTLDKYVTIRDFFTKQFTVIYINREEREIKVISCAGIDFYPNEGDVYVQRNEDQTLKLSVWKKPLKK